MELTKIKLGETSSLDFSKTDEGWVDSGKTITLKEALQRLKEGDCKHEKVYSNEILCSMPPQHLWICRKCGFEGTDRSEMNLFNEYKHLKEKFKLKKEGEGK